MKRGPAMHLMGSHSGSGEDSIDIDQGKVLIVCAPTTLDTKESLCPAGTSS